MLPLYPQYSGTTTRSSDTQLREFFARVQPELDLEFIHSYPTHPCFIQAWAERIQGRLRHYPEPGAVRLFFSAHGIPQRYVRAGDPYEREINQTFAALRGLFPHNRCQLVYQSKFGPGRWLEPSVEQAIDELPAGSQVLVVPISFVSEHVETIHEIGIEFGEYAAERGVSLTRVPGLNTSPRFIQLLANLVTESKSSQLV